MLAESQPRAHDQWGNVVVLTGRVCSNNVYFSSTSLLIFLKFSNVYCTITVQTLTLFQGQLKLSDLKTNNFQLKDINSRGEMRKFCIVLILGDRLEAVSHMLDAEKAMKDIAKHLTEKATFSYEKDVKNPAMNNSRYHSRVYIPDTNLRSLKQLLDFGDIHNFLHTKWV